MYLLWVCNPRETTRASSGTISFTTIFKTDLQQLLQCINRIPVMVHNLIDMGIKLGAMNPKVTQEAYSCNFTPASWLLKSSVKWLQRQINYGPTHFGVRQEISQSVLGSRSLQVPGKVMTGSGKPEDQKTFGPPEWFQKVTTQFPGKKTWEELSN